MLPVEFHHHRVAGAVVVLVDGEADGVVGWVGGVLFGVRAVGAVVAVDHAVYADGEVGDPAFFSGAFARSTAGGTAPLLL